jgi:hypothetical protein
MKTIALIGLIIVATASAGMAAETSMTIQTNTGIRMDPETGWIKGDAETQVRGIRKHHEAPQAVNTSPGGPSSANTGAATTPVTVTLRPIQMLLPHRFFSNRTHRSDRCCYAEHCYHTGICSRTHRPEHCYYTSWSSPSSQCGYRLPACPGVR